MARGASRAQSELSQDSVAGIISMARMGQMPTPKQVAAVTGMSEREAAQSMADAGLISKPKIDNAWGPYTEATWVARIDSEPAKISAKVEANRTKYAAGEQDVPGRPDLDLRKFFEENPKGKLSDVIANGDAISVSGYGAMSTAYRIVEVAGKSVTAQRLGSNGELFGEPVKFNYSVKNKEFSVAGERGRFRSYVNFGVSFYKSYDD